MQALSKKVTFRFYEELNDFLPGKYRKRAFEYPFQGTPSVKDTVQALGVPHAEVDLILVNSESVSFSYHVQDKDLISVYPRFEILDISAVSLLRPKPLRNTAFILDTHLGKLAKYLRMLGFDSLYRNDFEDKEIIHIAGKESRIILTRDTGILKEGSVTHGFFVKSQQPTKQLEQVLNRFDLWNSFSPFTRCMECNGAIDNVDKDSIAHLLKPKTRKYFQEFYQCISCGKVYWKGSHFGDMYKRIIGLKREKTFLEK